MEWPKHYACKKLLALLTHYDMIQRKSGYIDSKQLQATRIVKTRVKNGIPCFEIEWQKPEHYVDPEDEPVELFVVTVEEESLFQAAYPDVVALYQVEKSEVLLKKQKKRKDKPEEKELPNAYDEVTNLLSQINLKPTYRVLPVQHSMSDTKASPEDQTEQRSTGSEDVALAAASCITTVHMAASAAALAHSSVPSQCTKYSGISSSSSVPAGLQLSRTNGKGSSSSTSAHGGDDHDPAADLTTHIKHSHPLGHEPVRNSPEYSDTQSDTHSDSEDDLFSTDAVGQLHEWSLSKRILKKAPISSQPLSEDVMQLESLKCFKQTKETFNPDRNHVSSSCQLNKPPVQEGKNILSEEPASESGLHICQDDCKKAAILAAMVQKDSYISGSASLAFSGQTTETLPPECKVLPASQKPAGATGCHIEEDCIETTWKASFKKSVCKNRCSSSEDSDDGHMDKILVYEQQNRQLNPAQFKKCFTKKSSVVTSKRTNSDSALTIKGKKTPTNLKKAVNSFSVQVSPKPSSVEEIYCSQSPEQPIERLGSDPTQQDKRSALAYAWADSPLPLSERLKRRIKIN